MNRFIETITTTDPELRNRSFFVLVQGLAPAEVLAMCEELDGFRRSATSLYDRVRASLFLYCAYRFTLAEAPEFPATGHIPHEAFAGLLERRFEQAIGEIRCAMYGEGPNRALFSALAEAYHHLAFQTLLDQVRRSVRASRGNQWMFRVSNALDHPVRVLPELKRRAEGVCLYPVLIERTPVRLDLSHSGWSDIFFLGMDFPECARVLNISVDLGVYGVDNGVRPPVETYLRVIPEPVLRLTSVDLGTTKDISDLRDLFNFGNDYLSLLKAGVIASGFIPPSFEGTEQPVAQILSRVVGPGMGLELVTKINDIPKGSRLAVSTNLLACIISALMRATGQIRSLEGSLTEDERRLVASRAILGEWLGGSGGGWQDSGGIWPGLKVIEGALAKEGDPEFGISRGCLLPRHRILGEAELHPQIREKLAQSLVLIHGGMAQNVGPILEMVTEKYLLRLESEWKARLGMREIFDGILAALKDCDVRALADCTTRNWNGPLKTIIPWVTNRFTETIIARAREKLGDQFWGFLMLGGMSGGGMAMLVDPERQPSFRNEILEIMRTTKRELQDALPFAMDPVVYDFKINDMGTQAHLLTGDDALMPIRYYALQIPVLVRQNPEAVPFLRRSELERFTATLHQPDETRRILCSMVSNLFNVAESTTQDARIAWDEMADAIKRENGFDPIQHEELRQALRNGRIGLAHNRLPMDTVIDDVEPGDVSLLESADDAAIRAGEEALRRGEVAVLSLAGGVGSRWTSGAGVIKAINPFVQMQGRHRSFLEIHLAKSRRVAAQYGMAPLHLVSTSFLTHAPIEKHLAMGGYHAYGDSVHLSPGRSIAQRLIPMTRDLAFLWEEMPQETLDEQKQKVRDSVRSSLMGWARSLGEGGDYADNLPLQRFNPPGHWYEAANLIRNGVLARIIKERPGLQTLMLHNVDTLGADLEAAALGMHLKSGNTLTFEVVPRRIDDRGGGLARVNGRVRLLEGLAQPHEEDELKLSYYNSMTTWIQVDALLDLFGLTRDDLYGPEARLTEAVRVMAARMPTYVTIKDVKRRWGHGQEDVYPVAQFEKLWSDMTAISDARCGFLVVSRNRGQQLKDPNQLDAWANDGSREHVESLCDFA